MTNTTNLSIIKYEGIEISPGFVTNVAITRTFYSKMSSPYGKCRQNVETPAASDSNFYKYTVLVGKYTQNQCFEVCFQYKYVIPECKCADASVNSNINNVTYCTVR